MKNSPTATLVHGSVGPSLLRMALPMTISMIANMAFNLVDTYFIGRLGRRELAAMGFTFPVVFFITGSAMGMGIGVASTVSRAIGMGETERVRRTVTDSLLLSITLVISLVFLGLAFMNPVFRLMGASEDLLPLIRQYMVPLLCGIGFIIVPMVGNSAIRATGDTLRPSLIMLTAGLLNVALDPLLIFGLGPIPALGLTGAAIATVIAYASVCLLMLKLLNTRYGLLTFHLGGWRSMLASWREVLEIALPAIFTNQMIPVANGVLTSLVARHGEPAVAAWGVGTRLESLMMAPLFAMSVVMAPFVGQNHGALKPSRIRAALRFTGGFCFAWGAMTWAVAVMFAPVIASQFSQDPETLRMIHLYLWLVPAGYGALGWKLQYTSTFNARRRPLYSSATFLSRFFLFMIPLALLGNTWMGLPGLFAGIATANFLTLILAIGLYRHVFLKERDQEITPNGTPECA